MNYLLLKIYLSKLNQELKHEVLAKGKAEEKKDQEEKVVFTGSHENFILVLGGNENPSY